MSFSWLVCPSRGWPCSRSVSWSSSLAEKLSVHDGTERFSAPQGGVIRDPQRTHRQIVAAARELFAEHGADASLNAIAKRAGVGPGTLYRHFPHRENLLDAVIGAAVAPAVSEDHNAATGQTPREQLVACLQSAVGAISRHRGSAAKLMAALEDSLSPLHARGLALAQANAVVIDALQAEGALREGVTTTQLCWLTCSLAAAADYGRLGTDAMQPLIEIVADGLLSGEDNRQHLT